MRQKYAVWKWIIKLRLQEQNLTGRKLDRMNISADELRLHNENPSGRIFDRLRTAFTPDEFIVYFSLK